MSRALYHLSYGTAAEMLPSGCGAGLQLALLDPVLRDGDSLSLVHTFLHALTRAWDQDGCGGRIRSDDLRVMSPTRCRGSTRRVDYTRGPKGGFCAKRAFRFGLKGAFC